MLPIPCLYLVLAIALGAASPQLDRLVGIHAHSGVGVDAARDVLAATATGMIAFTGLVVSSVLLAVQFAAGQYSPRLVLWFRQDQLVKHAVGSFLAAPVFALVALREIEYRPVSYSPDITVILALVLLVGAALLFLALLQRVLDRLRPRSVYGAVAREGIRAARAVHPLPFEHPEPVLDGRADWRREHPRELRLERGAGVVTSFDQTLLVAAATAADVTLELAPGIGEFASRGQPLVRVHGEGPIDERLACSARLVWRTPSWSELLDLAFDEIRFYGAGSVQVTRRLRALLEDLHRVTPTERHAAIDAHLAWLEEAVRRTVAPGSPEEVIAAQADRIGLGMARCT